MDPLLVKKELDLHISREAWLEDVDRLFEVLRESYGLYHYYGEGPFRQARERIRRAVTAPDFDPAAAPRVMTAAFAPFLRDGHFRIGPPEAEGPAAEYAVRHTELHGIPMICCRKFWHDTEAERLALERFAQSGPDYRDAQALILDLRDNPGGSDIYIWEFIKGLYGTEPDYPCRFVQRYSPLFREYAKAWDLSGKPDVEESESGGTRIPGTRQFYVLINEGTASSGESAVACLKTIENTLVVGTHTAGCFTCGNCMTVYLPHSHIPVYFVLYEKTRNMDAEGGFRGDLTWEEFLQMIRT